MQIRKRCGARRHQVGADIGPMTTFTAMHIASTASRPVASATVTASSAIGTQGLDQTGAVVLTVVIAGICAFFVVATLASCCRAFLSARQKIALRRTLPLHRRNNSLTPSSLPNDDEPDFVIVTKSKLEAEKPHDARYIVKSYIKRSRSSLSSWEQSLFYDQSVATTQHLHVDFGADTMVIRQDADIQDASIEVSVEVPTRVGLFYRIGS